MSTGSTSSAAEQARLRRERREKKILAQGTSRLERIAGLQGGANAREVLHPDPDEPEISSHDGSVTSPDQMPLTSDTTKDSSHAVSPGRNVFSVDGGDEDPFSVLGPANDLFANVPEDLKNDPMMRLLLNSPTLGSPMQSGAATGGVDRASRDSSSDDLNQLAAKINKQLFGGFSGDEKSASGEVIVVPDTSAWKWKFARIVSVITILTYLWGQLEDYHFSRHMDTTYGMVFL